MLPRPSWARCSTSSSRGGTPIASSRARSRRIANGVRATGGWWRSYWHLAGLPDSEYLDAGKISARRVWRVWGVYVWRQSGEFPDLRECEGIDPREIGQRLSRDTPPAVRASV